MAPLAPMWWFKEVPVQSETFVDTRHPIRHIVPYPRNLRPRPQQRSFENQGGVFAFPAQYAKSVVWRTKENATALELTSLSGKENTPTRQITFVFHAPILPGVHLGPLSQTGGITITLLTADSVLYRLQISALSHFSTKDSPEGYSSSAQITWTTNSEPLLFKYLGDRQAAVASTNGGLCLIRTALLACDANRHDHAEVKIYSLQDDLHVNKIPHVSTIQKFNFLRPAPTLAASGGFSDGQTRMEVMAMETFTTHDDTLLFTLHLDRTIRVWSTGRRQCLQSLRTPASPNESGYLQETIDPSARAHLGIMFNPQMPWALRLLAYIPTEGDAQLSIYTTRLDLSEDVDFESGNVSTMRVESAAGPGSNMSSLVTLAVNLNEASTGYTLWGLWDHDTRISTKYLQIDDPAVEREHYDQYRQRDLFDGRWWAVSMHAPASGFIKDISAVDETVEDISRHFTDYVFASGRFSDRTIVSAVKTVFPSLNLTLEIKVQEQVVDAIVANRVKRATKAERDQERQDEIMMWTKFISTCGKIDHDASVPLNLSVASDTGYMIIVKQDSMSFLTACDESEILYHTFLDKQFEVAQLLATPPSQLRSTYPRIQDPTLRQDIAKVFMAMNFLTGGIGSRASKVLETLISQLSATNGPRSFVEVFSQEYLPRYISKADMNRARNLVGSCSGHTEVFQYLIHQLLLSASTTAVGLHSNRCILPYEALVAASVQQLALNRYAIAQNFLVLMTIMTSAVPSTKIWIQDEMRFVSDAVRIAQSLLILKWVSSQTVSGSLLTSSSVLEQQLSMMSVDGEFLSKGSSLHRQSLVGSLLKTMASESSKYGTVEFPIYLAIPRAVSTFLYKLGILNQGADEDTKYHAGLAQRLSGLGEMTLLSQYLALVPASSSMSYYQGKALLSQGKPALALEQFLAVTACFGNDIQNVEQELDIMQLDYANKLNRGQAKVHDYYCHVIDLLTEKDAHKQVIEVAKLALCEMLKNAKVPVTETQTRVMLAHIIVSGLSIGAYEHSYAAVMQISNELARKQYLRVFVTTICNRGDGAKLSLFPFKGVQDEVERLLLLSAQQSPVLSSPDYYSILSAYYTYRGDYRNVASVMCQHAQRLTDESETTESVPLILREAGKAYLGAINALHLAGPKSAWVSIPAVAERVKRRKIGPTAHGLPRQVSGLDQSSGLPCKSTIVHLSEIRKEYALITAKLKLLKEIPAHILSAVLRMTAEETVIMLVRAGNYDAATSLAMQYDLPLDVVFDHLVDRYLAAIALEQEELLGKDGLQDPRDTRRKQRQVDRTRSTNALLTLQSYLDRHDSASGTNFKYRSNVMARMLEKNADFDLQPWLTRHYLTHNPEDLIRLYLNCGALTKAAQFSSMVIQTAMKANELVPRHPNARWLPYSLLDEIFNLLKEQIEEGQALHSDQQDKVALEKLKTIKRQLDVDVGLYLENVERESIF
ncbi:hypothetical protein BGZ83_005520 [Gryganskiella cystojenkinii]|nr:hypothetical protein BGZ83_005520 [Gryganskiella cystojenkinii]